MDYFFKLLFSKGSAASISAILFFTPPAVNTNGRDVIINGSLNGIVTHKVHRIIKTGTPLKVHYHITLKSFFKNRQKVYTKKFSHAIIYSTLKKEYLVTTSVTRNKTRSLAKAQKTLGIYRAVFKNINPQKGEVFQVYGEAELSYNSSLKIPVTGSALWDYYIPTIKSRGIKLK